MGGLQYNFGKAGSPMKCPHCGYHESKVIDSRPTDEYASIRRRRECLACQRRFTTYEIVDTIPMMVVKKDGSKQMFDRNKILGGLLKSCDKLNVSRKSLEQLVDEVEAELQNSLETEHSTRRIGVLVMDKLKQLNAVAYVRFASVHREFKDLETFLTELEALRAAQTPQTDAIKPDKASAKKKAKN